MTYLEYCRKKCPSTYLNIFRAYESRHNINEDGIITDSTYKGNGIWDLFIIEYTGWKFTAEGDNSHHELISVIFHGKIPDFIKEIFPFFKKYKMAYYIIKGNCLVSLTYK